MQSPTEVCNMALLHLGSSIAVMDITSEASKEARIMNRIFPTALRATLRDYPWSFATAVETLGLVATAPNNEWGFSYRYPSDCLDARRILSGIRIENEHSRVKFRTVQDNEGRLIYCDMQNAKLEYTFYDEDVALYPDDFCLALSYRIASYAAPALTAGDPFKLRDSAMRMYGLELGRARSNDANENAPDLPPDADMIRARL